MSDVLIKRKTLVRIADAFRQRIITSNDYTLTIDEIKQICYDASRFGGRYDDGELFDSYKTEVSDEEVLIIQQSTLDELIYAIKQRFSAGPDEFNGDLEEIYKYILTQYMYGLFDTEVSCSNFYIVGIALYNEFQQEIAYISQYNGSIKDYMQFDITFYGYRIYVKYLGTTSGVNVSDFYMTATPYYFSEYDTWERTPNGEEIFNFTDIIFDKQYEFGAWSSIPSQRLVLSCPEFLTIEYEDIL